MKELLCFLSKRCASHTVKYRKFGAVDVQDMHRDAFADAPAPSLPIKDRRGFPIERMPRLVAGSDVAQGTIVDGSVIVIATSDAFILGILSSHIHRSCAERAVVGKARAASNQSRQSADRSNRDNLLRLNIYRASVILLAGA
jgi:hypothetical protein